MSQILLKIAIRIGSGRLSQTQSQTLGWIESEKPKSNPVKNLESNWVGTVELCKTANYDESHCNIYVVEIERILTRWRACGDYDGGRDAGTVAVAVSVDVDWAITYRVQCNRDVKRVPWGASLILEDFQVRAFGSSSLVDIPPDRLYVHTIPLSGCIDRRSNYSQSECFPVTGQSCLKRKVYLVVASVHVTRHRNSMYVQTIRRSIYNTR